MRAIILAGGLGTRVTLPGPKALVRLAGKPLLQWVLAEVDGLDTTVIVPGKALSLFKSQPWLRSVKVSEASSNTAARSLAEEVAVGDVAVVMHADEICMDSVGAVAYAAIARRFGLPVVGSAASDVTESMHLAISTSSSVNLQQDERLPSSMEQRVRPAAEQNLVRDPRSSLSVCEPARYIGRFSFEVSERLMQQLYVRKSVLGAIVASSPQFLSADLPKSYFDCGTDVLLEAARNRIGADQE